MICICKRRSNDLFPGEHNSSALAKFVHRDVTIPNFEASFTKDSWYSTRGVLRGSEIVDEKDGRIVLNASFPKYAQRAICTHVDNAPKLFCGALKRKYISNKFIP